MHLLNILEKKPTWKKPKKKTYAKLPIHTVTESQSWFRKPLSLFRAIKILLVKKGLIPGLLLGWILNQLATFKNFLWNIIFFIYLKLSPLINLKVIQCHHHVVLSDSENKGNWACVSLNLSLSHLSCPVQCECLLPYLWNREPGSNEAVMPSHLDHLKLHNPLLLQKMEVRGIEPRASRMRSERSTIWATPP